MQIGRLGPLNLIFFKNYDILYIESEGNQMFDDFDTQIQSDEIIPEEYEDWCAWMYTKGDVNESEN